MPEIRATSSTQQPSSQDAPELVAALQEALKDPTVKQRFADLGTEPVAVERGTPESLRKQLKSETDKWTPIIQKAGQYAD